MLEGLLAQISRGPYENDMSYNLNSFKGLIQEII